ncbi:MAG: CBS domain-containing protein [Actinomycetota bacterium]|nr:CBS domain-containing protein [Actinomycetota bacterium]
MSPRAACRLEALGFSAVYDYTAGKIDWLAAGLPTEGPAASTLRPGALARTEIPTCTLDDTVATARQRVAASGEDRCVVVSGEHIVLGVLDRDALAGDGHAIAAEAMRAGPATVRANEDLSALLERMHRRNVMEILVTDPDGRLLGLLHRDDADVVMTRPHGAPATAPD